MTFKQKILVIDDVSVELEEYEKLNADYQLIRYKLTTREQFAHDIVHKFSDIDAIWCLWVGFYQIKKLDKPLIDLLPPSLKIIAIASIGYDQYDAKALADRNILLTNSPGVPSEHVADTALHLSLSAFRLYSGFERALRVKGHSVECRQALTTFDDKTGKPDFENFPRTFAWGESVGSRKAHSPGGHKVGIIGFGGIGQATGLRLNAIGMDVHYHKRSRLSDKQEAALGYKVTYHETLESILKISDLVLLALPMTPETKRMINTESIKLLPQGARIVNVGRGGLIDQKALLAALESGKLSSVGLDVFEHEPIVEPELSDRYDVTVLPHVGSATSEAFFDCQLSGIRNIRAFLETGKALNPVN